MFCMKTHWLSLRRAKNVIFYQQAQLKKCAQSKKNYLFPSSFRPCKKIKTNQIKSNQNVGTTRSIERSIFEKHRIPSGFTYPHSTGSSEFHRTYRTTLVASFVCFVFPDVFYISALAIPSPGDAARRAWAGVRMVPQREIIMA